MKQAIRHLLLIGVLLGLFGQAVAFSQVPTHRAAAQQLAGDKDCMKAMTMPQEKNSKAPCQGITLDCIAAMGCTIPILLGEPMALEPAPIAARAPLWLDTKILPAGRTFAPDPDPPSLI